MFAVKLLANQQNRKIDNVDIRSQQVRNLLYTFYKSAEWEKGDHRFVVRT